MKLIFLFLILNSFIIIKFNKIKLFYLVLDEPDNKRKIHPRSTPLAGGVILTINIFFYFICATFFPIDLTNEFIFDSKNEINIFITCCLIIFILGLVDDKFNFNPILKFFILTCILSWFFNSNDNILIEKINFSFNSKIIILEQYSFLFTIFCFLVFMNAFNMFDGINLQSGSYSLIIFLYFAIYGKSNLFILIIIIFIISFLYLNYKDLTFLGDNGSLLISFIIGFIFIKLFNKDVIDYSDTVLTCMLVPGIDMVRLFFERIKNKKNPLSSDRNHLHHLLIDRFSLLTSILFINLMIALPIMLNYFGLNNFFIILGLIFFYIITILFLKFSLKH